MMRNYIDCSIGVPWSKRTRVKHNLENSEKSLNEDH